MRPEDHAAITVILLALLATLFFFFIVLLWNAKAEELSEISVKNAAYCSLYSREMVFIEMMHSDKVVTADTDYILALAKQHYADCLAVVPTLLPLPEEGSLKSWLADMRDLLVLTGKQRVVNVGTAPATIGKDDWREQCAREYRTWDDETGTVIRAGSPERVRCPCGGEVVCE
jgi:hypothetical protein